jgi:predicted nucleotidyltransferase
METTNHYIELLRTFMYEHGEEYEISRMGIFGSISRNEQTDASDLDIYYEGSVIGLLDSRDLQSDLENLLGVRVDLIRKHNYMNPTFLKRIMKDIIYV